MKVIQTNTAILQQNSSPALTRQEISRSKNIPKSGLARVKDRISNINTRAFILIKSIPVKIVFEAEYMVYSMIEKEVQACAKLASRAFKIDKPIDEFSRIKHVLFLEDSDIKGLTIKQIVSNEGMTMEEYKEECLFRAKSDKKEDFRNAHRYLKIMNDIEDAGEKAYMQSEGYVSADERLEALLMS
ncbi:hypothetical protein COB11_03640 [Candidatus Aerophobetes bacterium]|uniref:Uncharacterized protein n=1 Tax=Aerophobetes bacterium TaxID=2030807 RepID=A0A2A4YI96_UNCAE|nr:MAG: hypothetical protein COB11_03640 [Candidatus Aerophobetes bacterium]